MIPDITIQGAGSPPSRRLSPYRAPFEFYPTPPEATRAFLAAEHIDGSIWEPACGQGAIAIECEAAGYEVAATDLANYGYGEAGVDFLKCEVPRAKHIVTTPPYGHGLADRFIRQALALTAKTGGKVAMLLNLASLCDPQRHLSFVARPPVRIYALDECVCYPNGDPALAGPYTRQHRYCWMVWEQRPKVTTTFHWLATAPYRKGGASCP
jgi:predicted RNA methylase